MAKLTKDEFNTKYSEKIVDNDDLLIELMEDFADSISSEENTELESLREEIEKSKNDFLELKRKYKERFLNAVTSEEKEEDVEDNEELKEEEIIDVKEI